MNIILHQNFEFAEHRAGLVGAIEKQSKDIIELKADLCLARKEIAELKSGRSPTGVFEFGGHSSRSVLSASRPSAATACSPTTLAPPTIVVDGRSRSRSGSAKRKRTPFTNREFVLGTAEVNEVSVPVVKRIVKKRIFISRIAPGFSAEAMYKAVKPKVKRSLSVVKLKTLHSSYSSFCLYVEEEDEKTVLSPQFWGSGTIIKSFLGRLPDEKIDSRFDGPEVHSPAATPADFENTAVPNVISTEVQMMT